jgi:hypothetical protein
MQTQSKKTKTNASPARRSTTAHRILTPSWKPRSSSLTRQEIRQIVIEQIG